VEVGAREQRVVVEHLLEVGRGPGRVDGVAGEAAAHLVVDTAGRHRSQRADGHLPLAAAQQQLDRRSRGELRRVAEPAVARIVGASQGGDRLVEGRRADGIARGLQTGRGLQGADDLIALLADPLALLLPRIGDSEENHAPARHALARLGRKVRARVEGNLLGGDEGVEGPAAVAGHRLHGIHVDGVDVGALLAVDLDAHEVLVHERRDLGILE
jgi:hypothetical protein